MARTAALPALKAESGLSQYLDEIRRFPMLEPQARIHVGPELARAR